MRTHTSPRDSDDRPDGGDDRPAATALPTGDKQAADNIEDEPAG